MAKKVEGGRQRESEGGRGTGEDAVRGLEAGEERAGTDGS